MLTCLPHLNSELDVLINNLRDEGELDDDAGLDVRRLAKFVELGPASLITEPDDIDDTGNDDGGRLVATAPLIDVGAILAQAESEAKATALRLDDITSTSTGASSAEEAAATIEVLQSRMRELEVNAEAHALHEDKLRSDASAKVAEARSNELKVQTLGAEVEGVRAQLKKIEDEAHAEQHHLHREAASLSEKSKHQTSALAHAEEKVADLVSQTRILTAERDVLNER